MIKGNHVERLRIELGKAQPAIFFRKMFSRQSQSSHNMVACLCVIIIFISQHKQSSGSIERTSRHSFKSSPPLKAQADHVRIECIRSILETQKARSAMRTGSPVINGLLFQDNNISYTLR